MCEGNPRNGCVAGHWKSESFCVEGAPGEAVCILVI
jgi:hypothetical protein